VPRLHQENSHCLSAITAWFTLRAYGRDGHRDMAHCQLYGELLEELEMPTETAGYRETAGRQSHTYVNMFHWLASRAATPE
jgi:hypothetical protein